MLIYLRLLIRLIIILFKDGVLGTGGGVGLLANNFLFDECPEDANANMCHFLKMHNQINPIYRIKYYGRLALKKVHMKGTMFPAIWLSESDNFYFGGPITFELKVTEKGDRNKIESQVYFSTSQELYPGKSIS